MNRKWIIIGISVVFLGLAVWRYSPTQVVKRRTETLLDVFSMGRDVGPGGRRLDVYRLNGLLADQIEVKASFTDEESVQKEDVESAYSWLCDKVVESKIEINKWQSIVIEDDTASLSAVVQGLVEMPKVRYLDGQYDARFQWRKIDGDWLLVSIDWQERP